MCFLLEAKAIVSDLLQRTTELFDLSLHFVEHDGLNRYLRERNEQHDFSHLHLHKPCQLNYNLLSDLDAYLHRLRTSCRLTKTHLRSLHAARITSSTDYIVLDDEIYDSIRSFKSKVRSTKLPDINLAFRKLVHSYQYLIKHLYGVHLVRDSHVLQPMVISIIRTLLSIADEWREQLRSTD